MSLNPQQQKDLDEVAEQLRRASVEFYAQPDCYEHPPIVLTFSALPRDETAAPDRVILVAPFMRSGQGKQVVASMAEGLADEYELVVFASEAWALESKLGDPFPEGSYEEHPLRKEVLVISMYFRSGVRAVLSLPITRDEKTKRATLGEMTVMTEGIMGRFAGARVPAGVTKH